MAEQDRRKYQSNYQREVIIQKKISFSRNSREDMELLDWSNKKPNFTAYVKRLIRDEMHKRK